METNETLDQQLRKHDLLIHKKFRKEYYTGLLSISFSLLISLGLTYHYLWKHSSFWLIVFSLLAFGLLLCVSHITVVKDKKNNQLVILDLEYRQAKEYQEFGKNRFGGDMNYESVMKYPFTW